MVESTITACRGEGRFPQVRSGALRAAMGRGQRGADRESRERKVCDDAGGCYGEERDGRRAAASACAHNHLCGEVGAGRAEACG